jgi:hypothetical protein
MNAGDEEIKNLLAREKIRDRLARLARGEDRRDTSLITAAFWSGATVDYGIFAGSFDEYLAWVIPGSPAIPVTQHVLGQSLIEIDDETALAETHVTSYHRVNMGDVERDLMMGGRYLDRFERRQGEWRIAQRTMLYDWFRDFGVSVDWSQGLMGMPFSGGHYTGAAVKDFSEIFFGKIPAKR